MDKENRVTQAAPLAVQLGNSRKAIEAILPARIAVWRNIPGWGNKDLQMQSERVQWEKDSTLSINFEYMPIEDLSTLSGLPISKLILFYTRVSDLRPLKGMRLRRLELHTLPGLTDLSPLKGMPLESIRLMALAITTLNGLGDSPITSLTAGYNDALIDISAVRTMPLKYADFQTCKALRDLTPLLDCPTLETVILTRDVKEIEVLRKHPSLLKISYSSTELMPAAEFWARYDAQQKAGAK